MKSWFLEPLDTRNRRFHWAWFRRRITHAPNETRAFDLDVAFHMCRIEFVSAGSTATGIINLIFSSRWQVCNEDCLGMANAEDGVTLFESHRIDLDVAFHMYRIGLYDSAHVKLDV